MKKNIFSVIITALTVINVVLTAIMFFVMMPTFTKTNNLLTQIASAINLDLNVDGEANGEEDYSLKDLETVAVTFDSKQNLNLKTGSDGQAHYALLDGYSLSVYKEADDYKDVSDILTNNQAEITDIIRAVIQSHSADDISEDVIKKEALEQIQEHLDSKAVKKVMLSNFMYQ
ncbi:MAG: flagellar basal body-associated FliL family protein [Lachnospiraceae bacterium]|nr:flagellar basal body-associated FliL family protein [Lachnospiraceae bacterium]